MKTLEKDRNRRYESASGIAADLLRYLNDEPVQACPPSVAYRLHKFARRNKRALATGVLLTVALLAVAGTLGWAIRDREASARQLLLDRGAREVAIQAEVASALKDAERYQAQEKWPEALSAVKRAEGLLTGANSSELGERVRLLRIDLEMVQRLEEIDLAWADTDGGRFVVERTHRAYEQAFREYGIDVTSLPPADAATAIRARPAIVVALTAALDRWARTRGATESATRQKLTALAQAVDPDPWRRLVRQAREEKDIQALTELASSVDLVRQPPIGVIILAGALLSLDSTALQIEVLRGGQRRYPGNFLINFELALALRKRGASYRGEVVSFSRAALAVRPQSAAAHYTVGIALASLKSEEAIAAYHKAIELDPKYSEAYAALGGSFREQKNLSEAVASCQKAIQLNPNSVSGYANLSLALRDMETPEDALVACDKALTLAPLNARIHGNRAIILRDLGKLPEAVAAARKAIQLDATLAYPHDTLGTIFYDQQRLPEAVTEFRQSIELAPQIAFGYNGLGMALAGLKQFDEAAVAFRKALDLDPNYDMAFNNLGSILVEVKKFPEAIASYHRAIELKPQHSLAHANLAVALLKIGEREQAVAAYRAALEVTPTNNQLRIALGDLLLRLKKWDEALDVFRQAVELEANNPRTHYGASLSLARQEKWEDAVASCQKAVDLAPNSAFYRVGLGDTLRDQGKLEDAVAEYRKGSELDPQDAGTHYRLGLVLLRLGKLDESVTEYSRAIDLDPDDAVQHYALSWLLNTRPGLRSRYPERALASARRAVELKPQDGTYVQGLGYAEYRSGNWKAAVAAFERVKELGSAGDSLEWFPLAMAQWQLGDKDAARKTYEQAVAWMNANKPKDEFLRGLQVEAAELMGIELENK